MEERVAVYGRRILLSRDFATRSHALIEESVVRLHAADAAAPIEIWIDSGGGYVNKAQMLGDLFSKVSTPIVGVVVGVAYSAAFYLLQLCDVRVAWPSSQLLFHCLEGGPRPSESNEAVEHGFIDRVDTTRVEKDLSALLERPS